MTGVTLDEVYQELQSLKQDVETMKLRLDEDFELSAWAKERLQAYKDDSKTASHRAVKARLTE